MDNKQYWTAVATSEYIKGDKPIGIVVHGIELVLFRDQNQCVRVLEDRCPHRRVPLSLGTVCEGRIRCAYHGWSFDGSTGACVDIPNLDRGERISPRYRVKTFQTCERDGFVFVAPSSEKSEPPGVDVENNPPSELNELYGNSCIAMPVTEYVAALLDGPETLLRFGGVGVSDFFLGDPVYRGNWLVCDREASWDRGSKPPGIKAISRPLILRVEIERHKCAAKVWLLNADEEPLAVVTMGFSSGMRSTTTLCWRYRQFPAWRHNAPVWLRLFQLLGLSAVDVYTSIPGDGIAGLLKGPSRHLELHVMDQHKQVESGGELSC
ncbi:Rieske (2Fe-2S) protein [Pseudomaricurvus alkylphenolicus]|uniref:Rieske (2Fe-2S) protein n=1 Tax=Pseudomaricurvus alkylphenolicus TaxID=1306991 RepID=UPI0014222BCE|nr:Rieske (2Fe-2S) protein [Pseudomaricurvus alkylphenolicus]NIB44081.1 Rieske (2Fe-2S) protein [Pseudomaricurvus alkylphenolicus]